MRVAIVNDLALAREVLRRLVVAVPGYSVAWAAADGEEAVRMAAADRPDAILMDLVLPKLDGAEASARIMAKSPCPIMLVTSSVSGNFDLVCRALGKGALDAVDTPALGPGGTIRNGEGLVARLKKLDAARAGRHAPAVDRISGEFVLPPVGSPPPAVPVVAVGASTGGPDALLKVLGSLSADFPAAVLVAQHITAEFAPKLAEWLGNRCKVRVRAAAEGDPLVRGEVLLACRDDHLRLRSDGRVGYTPDPVAYPFRPSADVLFTSLADYGPRQGVGVLLTGMGADGAAGLGRLRRAGWHTIAQNEATCVVYGMPKAAVERGAAVDVLPLADIGPFVQARVRMQAGKG